MGLLRKLQTGLGYPEATHEAQDPIKIVYLGSIGLPRKA